MVDGRSRRANALARARHGTRRIYRCPKPCGADGALATVDPSSQVAAREEDDERTREGIVLASGPLPFSLAVDLGDHRLGRARSRAPLVISAERCAAVSRG